MHPDPLPVGQVKLLLRQGQKTVLFLTLVALPGLLTSRTVPGHPILEAAPVQRLAVGLTHGQIGMHLLQFAKQIPYRWNHPFDFAFVFRTSRTGWINEAAVMFGHLPVERIELRVIEVGLQSTTLQTVNDDPST